MIVIVAMEHLASTTNNRYTTEALICYCIRVRQENVFVRLLTLYAVSRQLVNQINDFSIKSKELVIKNISNSLHRICERQ